MTDKTTLVENLDSYSEEELHQILTQLCSSPPASKASKSESSAKPKRGFQSIPAYFGSAHRTTSSGFIIDLEQTESLCLGEMTVTAYSLVKGRNALHAGQRVRLVRPSTTSLQPIKRSKMYFHAKAASAPPNSIVRMESESNCELLGKIATETASFICKLMDFGLVLLLICGTHKRTHFCNKSNRHHFKAPLFTPQSHYEYKMIFMCLWK